MLVTRSRVFAFLLVAMSIRCMPDIHGLSTEYNPNGGTAPQAGTSPLAGGAAGEASGGTGASGGRGGSGTGGRGGSSGGRGGDGSGGDAGSGRSGESGMGGSTGDGGEGNAAGTGGDAGESGKGGTAGSGGTSAGTGGTSGMGGEGGMPDPGPTGCVDGCALLYIPFSEPGQTQFFTLQLGSEDLSQSVVTANVRVIDYQGTSGSMKLYASGLGFEYCCGQAASYSLASLTAPTTVELNLTNTAGWDNTKVGSFGFQVFNDSSANASIPLHIVVEDVQISNSDAGPWLFQEDADDLGVNPYQMVEGTTVTWIPGE